MPISVAIVDDDPLFAEGLEKLLNRSEGFICGGVCRTAGEARERLPLLQPHVVLMDIELGDSSGVECVLTLRDQLPKTEFAMLTVFEDYDSICQSLIAGASGYLTKGLPPDELLRAIKEVHQGASPLSGPVARKIVNVFRRMGAGGVGSLTLREEEVLKALATGRRYKEIAEELGIDYDTVRKHVQHIKEKLRIRSRAHLVRQFAAGFRSSVESKGQLSKR